jgi:hypothetical protein
MRLREQSRRRAMLRAKLRREQLEAGKPAPESVEATSHDDEDEAE